MGGRVLGWVGHAIGVVALVILGVTAYNALTGLSTVTLPTVPYVEEDHRIALNAQKKGPDGDGWGPGEAQWFHHTSQGTRILPLDWFLNLQQPMLSPYAPRLIEGDYLLRFGFLPSERDSALNPYNLPIGFAIDEEFDAPYANPPSTGPVVGLTCAACHTGQILREDDRGELWSARIEGGSAMINISAFQEALRLSVGMTAMFPTRFDRFARRVLGDDYGKEEELGRLREQLDRFVAAGREASRVMETRRLQGTESGFARTDALTLIGNRVFSSVGEANLIAPEAPVNFPPLWDTPWFDWVQYNASIRMPLVRNIGEALGVGAPVNLDGRKGDLFRSTVDVENLHRMEDMLGGDTTFAGLRSPRWDDLAKRGVLPELIPDLVREGAALYKAHCRRCHRPPMEQLRAFVRGDELEDETRAEIAQLFEEDAGGQDRRILTLKVVDLAEIGTDPNQALDFYGRTAVFRGNTISAAVGLYAVTESIRHEKFAGLGIPDDPSDPRFVLYNRFRDFDPPESTQARLGGAGMDDVLVANLGYRARPLDGVWATPPYLHNGSVPNLEQMLLPAGRRDRTFYLGTTRFDAEKVGYETEEFRGGFLLNTTLPGNSNAGHEFRNLTLEELESVPELWSGSADRPSPKSSEDEATRWAWVLGLPRDRFLRLSESERWESIRDRTRMALEVERVRRDHPFQGVLGAEFTDDQRQHLVEYLKSL